MSDIQINIIIFGSHRCGKTSILSTMQSCFEQKFSESQLTMNVADKDTLYTLQNANREFYSLFQEQYNHFIDNITTPLDIETCKFKIELRNKNTDSIIANFIEYPNELLDKKEKFDELKMVMKNIHVIIVAIDSPYLMEETVRSNEKYTIGIYNNKRNYCNQINEWIRITNYFNKKTKLPIKMILFVPLKCEKYYHTNQMDKLNTKVHIAYQNALNFFQYNEKFFEVAITPILTLGGEKGGIEFSDFERDENNHIIEDPYLGTPQRTIYKFTKNTKYAWIGAAVGAVATALSFITGKVST